MERPSKRQKLDNAVQPLLVSRTDDIHAWLEFAQNTGPAVKDGINNFKNYLLWLSQLDDLAQQSKQLRILKEYCEWQKAPSDDQLHFYDILSTWSFAVDSNTEAILSAIPATLAQFLRTISGILELRSFGLALVDTLLRRDQSKLFEKCLISPRTKPHLASPCLRLLTEMVCFDAGARAPEFWARRDLVTHKLDILLEQQNTDHASEARRKPSVRRMALRLFLSLMKYLNAPAKSVLLTQARSIHVILRGLSDDGDDVVVEILQSFDRNIILDKDIPRAAVIRLFNSTHLEKLAALYAFEADEDDTIRDAVRDAAHKTLLLLCTTEHGVIVPNAGWYPRSIPQSELQLSTADHIDLGLDSPYYNGDSTADSSVINTNLSVFLQRLHPGDDGLQSQLVISTLRAVPELVADYFAKCKPLPTAASDDASWRSIFAFFFSALEMPIPESFESKDRRLMHPPPPATIVENILPKPLDRAYLMKLLSSDDDILRISGVRAVTVILNKLERVLLAISRISHENSYGWAQVTSRMTALMESRLPPVREILLVLQRTSRTSNAIYSALLECITAYYLTLPNVAATSNFDVGPIMNDICKLIENEASGPDGTTASVDELTSAVRIASLSSSTKWLQKANNDVLSPFGQVLRTIILRCGNSDTRSITQILRRALTDRGMIHSSLQSFAALYSSLEPTQKFSPEPELFVFLDNCMVRANQKPVKCVDEIENISQIVSDKKPLSLYVGAIPEQWSFACKKHEGSKASLKNIALWIARVFALLDPAGENHRVITHFQKVMLDASEGKPKEYLQSAFDKVCKKPPSMQTDGYSEDFLVHAMDLDNTSSSKTDPPDSQLLKLVANQIAVPQDLSELDKWPATLDIELEIQTERLLKLVLCVASTDNEIRLQTLQFLQSITYTIDTSSDYDGKSQIYLVLGELIETIKNYGLSQPVPTIVPELTNALLQVLVNPTHELYAKANEFLLQSPVWTPKRTITYWLENILLREPDGDEHDSYLAETKWLLTWLLHGLRTEDDLNLYRRSGLWEHLLSLYGSPVVTKDVRILILAIAWKGCDIPSGAEMLWTRFGVYKFLEGQLAVDTIHKHDLMMVLKKIVESSDEMVIKMWESTCPLNKRKTVDMMQA